MSDAQFHELIGWLRECSNGIGVFLTFWLLLKWWQAPAGRDE